MDSWTIQIRKKKRVEMDRDIEKEGNFRETAAQDSRKRLWHAGDFFAGGQGASLSDWTEVETYFAGEEE